MNDKDATEREGRRRALIDRLKWPWTWAYHPERPMSDTEVTVALEFLEEQTGREIFLGHDLPRSVGEFLALELPDHHPVAGPGPEAIRDLVLQAASRVLGPGYEIGEGMSLGDRPIAVFDEVDAMAHQLWPGCAVMLQGTRIECPRELAKKVRIALP